MWVVSKTSVMNAVPAVVDSADGLIRTSSDPDIGTKMPLGVSINLILDPVGRTIGVVSPSSAGLSIVTSLVSTISLHSL